MLSHEENELITRVGPDTPLGTTMRRYWLPALLSREIGEPDCPPVRVRLLGEPLVAFRDTEGRIGLMDEFCPHRRVSLYFGRNEECGLRCVYHGWKFDVNGACVDMMNEPADLTFKDKIRIQTYPTVDMGGIIWAYMGPPELQPPLPKFAWTQAPASHRNVSKVVQESNWLQALEGGIDTSHAPILHRNISSNTGAWQSPTAGTRAYRLRLLVCRCQIGRR
jgi:phenylpropionate dioxygenase-like ring-hydroxylating dioxygenase large terminal subunit